MKKKVKLSRSEIIYILQMSDKRIDQLNRQQLDWYGEGDDFSSPTVLQMQVESLKKLKVNLR